MQLQVGNIYSLNSNPKVLAIINNLGTNYVRYSCNEFSQKLNHMYSSNIESFLVSYTLVKEQELVRILYGN